MASLCEFELGSGDVDLQMVSGYHSAESEEQYAVHVRDQPVPPPPPALRWNSECPATFATKDLGNHYFSSSLRLTFGIQIRGFRSLGQLQKFLDT